ncbi:hypothetical protein BC827DRAFT_426851 [Russula dissimulans]|nr:hypothetical protein BC827DRAFT_426851 [Russula dissimulans]
MTDEEENRGTDRWPSRANILRAIDNLVRNASSEDAFVFYYAGHCGQETLTIDSVDIKHQYIITCDGKKVLENTLHEHLVKPLPMGSRLRAIFDSCYSGQLLALSYYRCHVFLRTRCQCRLYPPTCILNMFCDSPSQPSSSIQIVEKGQTHWGIATPQYRTRTTPDPCCSQPLQKSFEHRQGHTCDHPLEEPPGEEVQER